MLRFWSQSFRCSNTRLDQKIAELKEIPGRDAQIAAANELEVEAFKQYGIMPGSVAPDRIIFKEGLANVGSMAFSGVCPECIAWLK